MLQGSFMLLSGSIHIVRRGPWWTVVSSGALHSFALIHTRLHPSALVRTHPHMLHPAFVLARPHLLSPTRICSFLPVFGLVWMHSFSPAPILARTHSFSLICTRPSSFTPICTRSFIYVFIFTGTCFVPAHSCSFLPKFVRFCSFALISDYLYLFMFISAAFPSSDASGLISIPLDAFSHSFDLLALVFDTFAHILICFHPPGCVFDASALVPLGFARPSLFSPAWILSSCPHAFIFACMSVYYSGIECSIVHLGCFPANCYPLL